MFFVVMLFLLLFTGFCTVILALAISDIIGQRGSEKPICQAGDATSRLAANLAGADSALAVGRLYQDEDKRKADLEVKR